MVAAAVIGGIVGAKLWYVALNQDFGRLLSRGGLVWYGGFIGGALAVMLNGWRLGVPLALDHAARRAGPGRRATRSAESAASW